MRHRLLSFVFSTAAAVAASFVFSSCETTPRVTQALPAFEPPMAKSDFQHVRTTAYTDTESDHRPYGARNALGGELHAAGPGVRRADNASGMPADVAAQFGYERLAYNSAPHQPFSDDEERTTVKTRVKTAKAPEKGRHPVKKAVAASRKAKPPKIGSAAADWSRWPAGTTFRLLSTGQMYRVEDYGWALAGRNTIDLYMPDQKAMNTWGAREEPIQILHWGDPNDSLKLLLPRMQYKHVRRMVLELQGNEEEAAAMR